ncbi:hypothetical protein T05_14319 [Trichinella murrelli]|uniref:Uncharacterized protein n=1 Tax=Trichinella murrelli TaxID=144512 RepID=A0A0V0U385_9BILA|nr:hypothetical protein T05_14319 [Trichinella murrelli]
MYGSIFTILITRRASEWFELKITNKRIFAYKSHFKPPDTPGSVGGPSGSLGTKLRPERVIFVHLAGDLSTPNDHYSIWHTDSKNAMRVGRHHRLKMALCSLSLLVCNIKVNERNVMDDKIVKLKSPLSLLFSGDVDPPTVVCGRVQSCCVLICASKFSWDGWR